MKPVAAKTIKPCRHTSMHFENQGLHIVCDQCKRPWLAVLEPHRIIQDLNAYRDGLTDRDKRIDPFSTPI